jgi:hypothetical protein
MVGVEVVGMHMGAKKVAGWQQMLPLGIGLWPGGGGQPEGVREWVDRTLAQHACS